MEEAVSVIGLFDEIAQKDEKLIAEIPKIYDAFSEFVSYHLEYVEKMRHERADLKKKVQDLSEDCKNMEETVQLSRMYLDEEKKKFNRVLKERDQLLKQMETVRELLQEGKIHDETKEKLSFLHKNENFDRLDTILEHNSTGYLMSDLSITIDDDDDSVETPVQRKTRRHKRRSSAAWDDIVTKDTTSAHSKRSKTTSKRSISLDRKERVIATTTVTVPENGPVSAKSIIEGIPGYNNKPDSLYKPSAPPIFLDSDSDMACTPEKVTTAAMVHPQASARTPFANCNSMDTRPHMWIQKAIITGEVCNSCNKRIKFSKLALKCKQCKSVAHTICKDDVPLPCVPVATATPTKSKQLGCIGEYTPLNSPMVPPLVIYCIKEVEARGMSEVGLYRVPGSDKEVKALKEKLLKVRGVPNLSSILDIHVICGCLKEFLRSLREPLITHERWFDFSRAVDMKDPGERKSRLYQILSSLPTPNRDTLAYIALHLQKIAATPDVKMSVSNLAKMFGPSIIGFSKHDPENMMIETNQGNKVMSELIALPTEYWESFIKSSPTGSDSENQCPSSGIPKTPSNNSILNFFGASNSVKRARNIKFFETP